MLDEIEFQIRFLLYCVHWSKKRLGLVKRATAEREIQCQVMVIPNTKEIKFRWVISRFVFIELSLKSKGRLWRVQQQFLAGLSWTRSGSSYGLKRHPKTFHRDLHLRLTRSAHNLAHWHSSLFPPKSVVSAVFVHYSCVHFEGNSAPPPVCEWSPKVSWCHTKVKHGRHRLMSGYAPQMHNLNSKMHNFCSETKTKRKVEL